MGGRDRRRRGRGHRDPHLTYRAALSGTNRKDNDMDTASQSRDRGICPVCGREYEITKKGTVRLHRRVIASRGVVKTAGCRGGGEPPKAP